MLVVASPSHHTTTRHDHLGAIAHVAFSERSRECTMVARGKGKAIRRNDCSTNRTAEAVTRTTKKTSYNRRPAGAVRLMRLKRSAEFNTGHSAWYDSTRHRLHRTHPSIINRRHERKLEEKNRQEFFRHPKPSPLRFITFGPFSTYARITDSPIEYTSRAFVGDLRYPADNTTRDTPRPKMDGSNRQTGIAFQVSYDTSASCPPKLFACPRDVTPMTRKEPSHPRRPAPKACQCTWSGRQPFCIVRPRSGNIGTVAPVVPSITRLLICLHRRWCLFFQGSALWRR